MAASIPAAHASCWRERVGQSGASRKFEPPLFPLLFLYLHNFLPFLHFLHFLLSLLLPPPHRPPLSPPPPPHLSVVQVAEASDDLLLVQLVGFKLHASHCLHEAVVLKALLPGQLRLQRRPLLQAVQVALLLAHNTKQKLTREKVLQMN